MNETGPAQVEAIAMHGWASDARCWQPWIGATEKLGWHWQCGERGYGEFEPFHPAWPANLPPNACRIVIGHSLGPHLVAPEVLRLADAVVLIASFGTFVPPDRAGRRMRAALEGMADKLGSQTEAKEMLRKFLANVAAPQSSDLLPQGPVDGTLQLDRLRADLEVLRQCEGLPRGFPLGARVLIVEAGNDRIVDPGAQSMLREVLPEADVIRLEREGHSLLGTGIVARVCDWAESLG